MVSGANLEFLHQALRDRNQYDELIERFEKDFIMSNEKSLGDRMRMDLDNYLPNNVLALTDKATMAASVEGRVPLLDHRIVEFAYSLPSGVNLFDGSEKGLFKHVLKKYLPTSVLTRRKEGFNAPINTWVEQDSQMIGRELLGDSAPLIEDLIDLKVVKKWLDNSNQCRYSGDSMYALYLMNRWLKKHG